MNAKVSLKQTFEALESLMSLQVGTINQSIELQKKNSEQLIAFFKDEAEKAQGLKTPEEILSYNIEVNKALYELLKTQGEAFTTMASEAQEAAAAQIAKLTH